MWRVYDYYRVIPPPTPDLEMSPGVRVSLLQLSVNSCEARWQRACPATTLYLTRAAASGDAAN